MHRHKTAGRLFGLFFILSFLSYAIGSGLMAIPSGGDYPTIAEMGVLRARAATGGLLAGLVHTLSNLGLLAIMFHIIKPYGPAYAYVYLGAGLFSTFMLAAGAVWLLMPVIGAGTVTTDLVQWQQLLASCQAANFLAYQLGMAVWGFGGLILCYLLRRSGIVPRMLPVWGWVGYMVFITGTIAELYGTGYGTALSIPGGLFEIALSIWLMIKGFGGRWINEKR